MHVFAHNGHAPNVREHSEFRIDAFRPIGDTDSEYAFCALLERIKLLWCREAGSPTIASRLAVVSEFAEDFGNVGLANFLYSDGEAVFAHLRSAPFRNAKALGSTPISSTIFISRSRLETQSIIAVFYGHG